MKGLNEFQSIDTSLDFNDDEGDSRDVAIAPASPFGSTYGSKYSNSSMTRVPQRKRKKFQPLATTLVFEQPISRPGALLLTTTFLATIPNIVPLVAPPSNVVGMLSFVAFYTLRAPAANNSTP